MAIEVMTKRWGNSIGIVIPNETIDRLSIKPNESIVIEVTKKENVLKELFGSIKINKQTELLLKESQMETQSKWLK